MKRIIPILTCLVASSFAGASAAERPNIIFIMADDLGYGDLGSYGQQIIQTPRLDQMAAEGIRFTDFYAGATVCAPSRCVLMTGRHIGHAHVRGNAGSSDMLVQSLRDEDITVAEVMKSAGYATALIGKWGLGELDEPGHPLKQGFDTFYGYLNQVHAHNYYPEFLWRGREKEPLGNVVEVDSRRYGGFPGGYATVRKKYTHDLFVREALDWVRDHTDEPFFLYLPLTIPHANNEGTRGTGDGAEVPDHGVYSELRWPDADKGQAAMITRMDRGVGRLLDLLEQLDLAENTLVMFTSDNGPHNEAGHDPVRFNPSGVLRGMKRDLYEGGIRVPMIAWWPGKIQPGRVSDHIGYFGDLLATAGELAGASEIRNADSVSFVPELIGEGEQAEHEFLYWEFTRANQHRRYGWVRGKACASRCSAGRSSSTTSRATPAKSTTLPVAPRKSSKRSKRSWSASIRIIPTGGSLGARRRPL